MSLITCYYCNIDSEKNTGEINRQKRKGRNKFFCNIACSAKYINSKRNDLRKSITKQCPYCKLMFTTMTGSKEATFCCRACDSTGSVTE